MTLSLSKSPNVRFWRHLAVPVFAVLLVLAGQPAPAIEAPVYGQGLLWQIEGEGARPSYLFGTMHVTDDEVVDLPAEVSQAFEAADSLTVEIVSTPDAPYRMYQAMLLSDGRGLDQVVGMELFQRTAAVGASYGLDPRILRTFKPWAAMAMLSIPVTEVMRQRAGEKALDDRLQIAASQRGMTMHSLETLEEQLAVFERLSEAEQIAMLASVIDLGDKVEAIFEDMRQAYLARDTARILAISEAHQTGLDAELLEAFADDLINVRNDRMVERMAPRLSEGASFIAVGALHLPGERGILRQLEEQGYRVTRLY
jgi:uncharacterized protein YbaP (TraB family)